MFCFNPLTRIRSSLTRRSTREKAEKKFCFNPLTRIRSSLTEMKTYDFGDDLGVSIPSRGFVLL